MKKNGLLPGWPPFNEFKREMADLVSLQIDEQLKPVHSDIKALKEGVLSHIEKTRDNFLNLNNRMTSIENHLTSHITDTNKKIDVLKSDISDIKHILRGQKT